MSSYSAKPFQLKAGKEKSDKEDGVIDSAAKNP
jgi:hypothetical protein